LASPVYAWRRLEGAEMRQLALTGVVAVLVGCQSGPPPGPPTLSLDEAKKVSADFGSVDALATPPPPRTILDITETLAKESPDPNYAAALVASLDTRPPTNSSPKDLALYFMQRSGLEMQVGRGIEAFDDAALSVEYARQSKDRSVLLRTLGNLG